MVAGIIGFAIGAIFGVVMICCFVVASEEDDQMEKELREKENNKADSK